GRVDRGAADERGWESKIVTEDLGDGVEHLDCFLGHLGVDPVARQDGDGCVQECRSCLSTGSYRLPYHGDELVQRVNVCARAGDDDVGVGTPTAVDPTVRLDANRYLADRVDSGRYRLHRVFDQPVLDL